MLVGRLIKWLLFALLAWCALIVIVVTPLLNLFIDKMVSEATGRPFDSAIVLIDPIDLALSIEDVVLTETDGRPIASFQLARVDFGLWRTLINPGIQLESITLNDPTVHSRLAADGTLNLQQLADELAERNASSAATDESSVNEGELPQIHVGRLAIDGGAIYFEDQAITPAFSSGIHKLSVTVTELSTIVGSAPMSQVLSFELLDGGAVAWTGQGQIVEPQVTGSLSLSALELSPLVNYGLQLPSVAVTGGTLSAEIALQASSPEQFTLAFTPIALDNVQLIANPTQTTPDELGFQRFTVADIRIDGTKQTVTVNSTSLEGFFMTSQEVEDSLTLVTALTGSSTQVDDTQDLAATPGETSSEATVSESGVANNEPESAWTVEVVDTSVSEGKLYIETPRLKEGHIALDGITLGLDRFTWPTASQSQFDIDTLLNQHATVDVNGQGDLLVGDLAVNTQIADLRLSQSEPLFQDQLNIGLSGGSTSAELQISTRHFIPEKLQGRLVIKDFDAHIEDTDTNLLAFNQFRVEGIDLDATEQTLVLDKISLTGAQAALLIRSDGSINATRVQVVSEDVSDASEAYAEEIAEQTESTEDDTATWAISIPKATVSDSELTFRDESLPLQFTAVIADLSLGMRDFDTRTDSTLEFSGGGAIDGYAPVTIEGKIGHFSQPENGNFKLAMSGVDIARLTPYSATFVGYPINRGVMTTELDYVLTGGRVKGNNSLRVQGLELGKKTDSESALDLPVKTAVALLTDAAGVIELDLEVGGEVNDPQFNVWSALWQAAGTMVTNLVAAPFKLLASLGGAEEIDEVVRFSAGGETLDAAAMGQLDVLADGLSQRPQLTLVLDPGIHRVLDTQKLQRLALREQLLAEGVDQDDIDRKSPAWEAAIQARAVTAGLAEGLTPLEWRQQLEAQIQIPQSTLSELALERAAAVKRYLVNSGELDPERAIISPWDQSSDDLVGVRLDIEAR